MSFTFLAVSIFTMDPRTRTLVLGDSHIRRLHNFMSETPDAYSHNVFLDMALGERLDFHGMGGRTVQGIFDHDMEWVRWYQVRAKVYILERPPVEVHSLSLERTYYLNRPERSG